MSNSKLTLELSKSDIIFIYGHFQKQLANINKIAEAPECPFDSKTIKDQKAPYLAVIEKLRSQYPDLATMDKYF